MIKIAIDGGSDKGHAVRGIGVHTSQLAIELKKLESKYGDFRISEVDLYSDELSGYDLVHFPDFNPFLGRLPESIPSHAVITIHDVIPLIYPDKYPPGIRGRITFARQRERLKNFDHFITISHQSKKDIVRYLGIPSEKISVVYLAAKGVFKKVRSAKKLENINRKYSLPEKFILYVGDINYNKNIDSLVTAADRAGLPLVIAGSKAKKVAEGEGLVRSRGPKDILRALLGIPHPEEAHYEKLRHLFKSNKVSCLGFVPDEDLSAIYSSATLYCFPSFAEGFGLSILEAMACGAPVAASDIPVFREVAGDAVKYFDPHDEGSMSAALKSVAEDSRLRQKLVSAGYKKVKNYSWQKTAEQTLKVYNKVLGRSALP